MNIGDKIRQIRENKGIKRSWLAQNADISVSHLYKIESGLAKPSKKTLRRIAEVLGVPIDYLLKDQPVLISRELSLIEKPLKKIPIYGRIPAGGPKEVWDDYIEGYISLPDVPDDGFALKVSGDSMTGEGIEEGDVVVILPNRQIINGSIVVTVINGTEFTLKKYIYDKQHIILQPANEKYNPIVFTYEQASEMVRVIGVVIGVYKRKA
jgi:repressor LexA